MLEMPDGVSPRVYFRHLATPHICYSVALKDDDSPLPSSTKRTRQRGQDNNGGRWAVGAEYRQTNKPLESLHY